MTTLIGSISHGTMRPEDLIPCFLETLQELDKDKQHTELIAQVETNILTWGVSVRKSNDNGYWGSDNARWDTTELFDALDEFAPPYHYFGAHPGDGSDYGFWFCEDSFRQAVLDGEIMDIESKQMPEYFCSTNDHGNVTLYDRDMQEVWAIV